MHFDVRLLRNLDRWLLLVVAALIAFGLVAISSAARGYIGAEGATGFLLKQVISAVMGLTLAGIILLFDYEEFGRMWPYIYGLNIAFLVAVLVIGKTTNGAQAWIPLGPVHLEPGEYGKVMLILTLAHRVSRMERIDRIWDLVPVGLHVLPPLALIMLQPDLGTGLVYVSIAAAMVFVAGFPAWKLLLAGGIPVAGVVGWVAAHVRWGVWIFLDDYQVKRLTNLVNPLADIIDSGYQVFQSIIAIGSGGLLGKGLYQGTQNQLGFLPEQHTDFIFSVIGEEMGFVGGLLLILLYSFLLWRILAAASAARDAYGSLIVTGVAAMLFFHILENIGMTMGVMPVTGIPLPFISYGGSSLITNLMAIGLVLNVGMRRRAILF